MLAKVFAVATCAFAALVSAQEKLQFTQVPANAQVGVATTITWAGGDDSQPVTLTLREGDPNNLATIAIITGSATGHSFSWTPASDIPPADDYALQISQGEASINFSGFFSIVGGSAPVSTTVVAVGGSTTVPITTLSPNTTSAIATTTTSVSVTAILTGTGSVGTGTTISRNTTFVSQTLSATGSSGASVTPTSSFAGTTTAASSSSAPVSSGNAAAALKAQVGLGVGAFAAALFML